MANTIMTAKNSFQEGLIMDFSPDNTQATCMTSALNATLLTLNGNEMSLQNDMGNGRVETARLPEGYIPVGTCEFGDIIYIVSYNPITNKSQIGCFPSPERNISSEELYDGGKSGYQNLSYKDFQEIDSNGIPTGKLKNTSVKKVLIDSKKLNPGDKYIIYSTPTGIKNNAGCLSDYGKIGEIVNQEHNKLPKYVKLHVVSIEDSGKITYLDTTTKWYDVGDYKYYLSTQKIGTDKSKDLDSYRDLVESNWSIFNSKISGKLAILAELEMIDTFSCQYELESVEGEEEDTEYLKYKSYNLYLCPDYTSDKNIKLPYICLTRASFDNSFEGVTLNTSEHGIPENGTPLKDDQVYYYSTTRKLETYKTTTEPIKGSNQEPIPYAPDEFGRILIGTITIPYKHRENDKKDWEIINSKSFVYTMEITPAMEYGRLDHLTTKLVINFNKLGTGDIALTTWKYHNSGNTSIFTYGIEAYPEPNWEVSGIVMQFYDNKGLVGEYLLNDKKYYSGTFTEHFRLNEGYANSRFTSQRSQITQEDNQDLQIQHPGMEITDMKPEDIKDSKLYVSEGETVYMNDAGTLYSGFVYGVKIWVMQKRKNGEGIKYSEPEYRWYWTNPMFNNNYYSAQDFKELNFELILNGEAIFETTPQYQWKQKELNNLDAEYETSQEWKTQSANAQYIGYGKEHNINMYVYAGLQDNYGCFNLHGFKEDGKTIGDIKNINLDIYLSKSEIRYSTPENQYEFSHKEGNVSEAEYLQLVPQTNTDGGVEVAEKFEQYLEHPDNLAVKVTEQEHNIKDLFNIYFKQGYSDLKDPVQEDGSVIKTPVYSTTLDKCYYSQTNKEPIPLSMQALLFNKAYVQGEQGYTMQIPVYTPIIETSDDLAPLGIVFKNNNGIIKMGFESAIALCHIHNDFSAARLLSDDNLNFYAAEQDDSRVQYDGEGKMVDPATTTDFIDKVWGNINSNMLTFFPVYLGGHKGDDYKTKHYNAVGGTINGFISTDGWKYKNIVGEDSADKQNSKLTKSSFDIHGTELRNLSVQDSISFLGVKYKNGFTLLNNAFLDSISVDNKSFTQKDYLSSSTGYDNFAYQLFLLLTNTYHKNKKIENQQIRAKNYVRNGNYSIELIKNIFIHLLPKPNHEERFNIIMSSLDFNEYIGDVSEHGFPENFLKEPNVILKFIDYAKSHELKIVVNSQPMSFFDVEIDAYIRKNGILIPVFDLAPNCFYVYQNGELNQFSNSVLTFNVDNITKDLKYIFSNYTESEKPELQGVHFKQSTEYSDEDEAYNTYIKYIKEYVSQDLQSAKYYNSQDEALQARSKYIDAMFDTFPDSIKGYSKIYIREVLTTEGVFENTPDRLFSVQQNGSYYVFVINNHMLDDDSLKLQLKPGTIVEASYCEFAPYNFLNIFDYQDQFMTSPTKQFGNTFGVKDGGNNKKSAYTGFAKDILLNNDYKVV